MPTNNEGQSGIVTHKTYAWNKVYTIPKKIFHYKLNIFLIYKRKKFHTFAVSYIFNSKSLFLYLFNAALWRY
jgi:hypothetical protein